MKGPSREGLSRGQFKLVCPITFFGMAKPKFLIRKQQKQTNSLLSTPAKRKNAHIDLILEKLLEVNLSIIVLQL